MAKYNIYKAINSIKEELYISIPTSDSTSVTLLEAMAAGSLPIVSDLPANREWIEDGKNGFLLEDMSKLNEKIAFYLDGLTNWNEAMVYSYEIGKKYTTNALIEKWKEVIDFVKCD